MKHLRWYFAAAALALSACASGNQPPPSQTVADTGVLMESVIEPNADVIWLSVGMVDTGAVAIKAAEAKDPDAMFEAGAQIYAVCSNCHAKYDPSISRVQ
jgi:PBP1b-binding outer membrane lipoprotein LpoB